MAQPRQNSHDAFAPFYTVDKGERKQDCMRLLINLTPFIPLSLKGEGEEILERGEAPLLLTLPLPLIREGG